MPQPTRRTNLLISEADHSVCAFGAITDFRLRYSLAVPICTARSVARREISSNTQTRELGYGGGIR